MPPLFIAGYDGSEGGDDAVALASLLARAYDARLLVAHIDRFEPTGQVDVERVESEPREEARRIIERAHRSIQHRDFHTRLLTAKSRAHGLHQIAQAEGASLVVVGSSRRGALGRVFAGTVSERLLNGAPCPIGVAPRGFAGREGGIGTVGVAYDGSDEARAAVRAAESLARRLGAGLRVTYIVDEDVYARPLVEDVRKQIDASLEELVSRMSRDLEIETVMRHGDPAEELLKACEDGIDLLVLGSRGYGPVGSVLLGSVSHRVVREAPCAVVVVPRAATETLDTAAPTGIERSAA
jgi:nucleotide-binding universal stress UspA family protein